MPGEKLTGEKVKYERRRGAEEPKTLAAPPPPAGAMVCLISFHFPSELLEIKKQLRLFSFSRIR